MFSGGLKRMSYEGYGELLCANGHYHAHDAYIDEPEECPICGALWAYSHGVDQTNGVEEGNPHTMPAPLEEIGHDDDWREDRHGNKYAAKIPRYKPLGEWTKLVLVEVAPGTKVYYNADYFKEHHTSTEV